MFNNRKMQKIYGQYFYLFDWHDGKALKSAKITKYHCEKLQKHL